MVFQALGPYAHGFARAQAPFLTYYCKGGHGELQAVQSFSRGEFWDLATRAANYLNQGGYGWGDAQVHAFSANHPLDLVWRLAATFVGTVPVTLNWQSDQLETILYKIRLTGSKLLIYDEQFAASYKTQLARELPGLIQVPADQSLRETSGGINPFGTGSHIEAADAKIIIFTSGTTGQPKGVRHSYLAYETNAATFDQFLGLAESEKLAVVVVNPLHHANATAMTDWCMRRPEAHIHLIERYTTDFWRTLVRIAEGGYDRIVVPLVSRHFDFLGDLVRNGTLNFDIEALRKVGGKVDFLLGSAPVGPGTVKRIQEYTGKLPMIRFGSTETCLQVAGTPGAVSPDLLNQAFQRGWKFRQGHQVGYYLGRPHPPFTRLDVVRAIDPESDAFMEPCHEGEPGFLVARGNNIMLGYVANARATAAARADGWYIGLQDKGYWLQNPADGFRDYYWMGRVSNMLIRGGANYANDALAAELTAYLSQRYGLGKDDFDLAVVGARLQSEHEDSCCVMVDLQSSAAAACREEIEAHFLKEAAGHVSKQARPNRLMFGEIPRNFKGAIQSQKMKAKFLEADGLPVD